MLAHRERIVFSTALGITRAFGWILITVAILGILQMHFLIGRLAVSFGLISSLALGLAGIVWLVGVEMFLLFFDRYLSRN
jgi:predicted tellurium resistance membrane protein TerC